MAKVIVYGLSADDAELLELLKAADCELVGEELLEELDHSDDDLPDAVVVVLSPSVEKDGNLEERVIRGVNRGCRIVGVWPKNATSGEPPISLSKYSSDQVTWDADKVRAAVCGDVEPRYDTATGSSKLAPDTPRNC